MGGNASRDKTMSSSDRLRPSPSLLRHWGCYGIPHDRGRSREAPMASSDVATWYVHAAQAPWPKPGEEGLPRATFAAGCFWGPELLFQRVPGVVSTAVGYTGGSVENPTYEQICRGNTGHAEAVEMTYKPEEVTYQDLVNKFYENHDPTTLNRQKNDVGTQYRSGIYYRTDEEKQIAEAAKAKIEGAVTEIAPLSVFFPAESYHQSYLANGGRGGRPQSAAKNCTDPIRCYG